MSTAYSKASPEGVKSRTHTQARGPSSHLGKTVELVLVVVSVGESDMRAWKKENWPPSLL